MTCAFTKCFAKNFKVNQAFHAQAKEMCKSTKLFEELFLLHLLVEPDQSSMVYQLPMINQMLCIVQVLGNSYHGLPLREV